MTEPDADELRAATALLERIAANRGLLYQLSLEERVRLLAAAGTVFCPDVADRRRQTKAKSKRRKAESALRDEQVLEETGIRSLRRQTVFTTPNVFPPTGFTQEEVADPDFREILEPRNCYICKQDYDKVHFFYDQLCPACSELNYRKRTESADLSGRVALLTGGRVKIGYQAGIKLLRAGAQLIMTTRFPRNAAVRFAEEADYDVWADRLEIFGLDLRHTRAWKPFAATFSRPGPGSISS